MSRIFPEKIIMPCFNIDCNNEIIFDLDNRYYKNAEYVGNCTHCGFYIRINKFSPFLENLNITSSSSNVSIQTMRMTRSSNSDLTPVFDTKKKAIKSDL